MGRFDFNIPEAFLDQLGRMADVDRYAPQMLEAAMPIVVRSVKAALSSVTSNDSSGQLVASVQASKIIHNDWGWFLTVRPTGYDKEDKKGYLRKGKKQGNRKVKGGTRDKVRNMEKAAWLEYGTSKQPARPWAERAVHDAMPEVLKVMEQVFERECYK